MASKRHKGKQVTTKLEKATTQVGDEGAMRECAHPPCKTKTTAQFCIEHSVMVGTFNKIDGNRFNHVAPGNRVRNR